MLHPEKFMSLINKGALGANIVGALAFIGGTIAAASIGNREIVETSNEIYKYSTISASVVLGSVLWMVKRMSDQSYPINKDFMQEVKFNGNFTLANFLICIASEASSLQL